MSFTPREYYSFTVYDGQQSTEIPNEFRTSNCTPANNSDRICDDTTTYNCSTPLGLDEFTTLPHVLLLQTPDQTPMLGTIYLTYYHHLIGTGQVPTPFNGNIKIEPIGEDCHKILTLGGLDNFWRSIVNVQPDGSDNYIAVSQACPIRNCIFKNLTLCANLYVNDPSASVSGGAVYTSGGFLGDCSMDKLNMCSQQQFLVKNCTVKDNQFSGGAWNITLEDTNIDVSDSRLCKVDGYQEPGLYTVVKSNGALFQAPRLLYDSSSDKYSIFYPDTKETKDIDGCVSPNPPSGYDNVDVLDDRSIPDITSDMKKFTGERMIIPAGVYEITENVDIKYDMIGIGQPIIRLSQPIRFTGKNQTVSSVIFECACNCDTLIELSGDSMKVFDLCIRVGGLYTLKDKVNIRDTALLVTGSTIYLENTWIWRADHGLQTDNDHDHDDDYDDAKSFPAKHGMIVNGDNMFANGLQVEHFDDINLIWNGNNGKVVMFQNEMPYFGESFNCPAVQLNGSGFRGYGMGSYCYFKLNPVHAPCGFEVNGGNVSLTNTFTVWLNGNTDSSIDAVIRHGSKTYGKIANADNKGLVSMVCQFNSGPSPSPSPSHEKKHRLWWLWLLLLIILIVVIILVWSYLSKRKHKRKLRHR